jgi:hydrogenase 3 maturation protease
MPRQPRLPSLNRLLQKRLEGVERLALLAIGSELRGDDAAGLLVADHLERLLSHAKPRSPQREKRRLAPVRLGVKPTVGVFRGHTAPENYTGAIRKYAPTHLVIVDAADLGQKPGHIQLLEPEQIGGVSFSTHQMPLSVLLDYLKTSFEFKAVVLTIQPMQMDYDRPVTPAVRSAARRLAAALANAMP